MSDQLHDDESAEDSSSSFRRIWKRRNGSQGSSNLALKAMAVLYDAGQPLTRDEIAERLKPRLDPYECDYLEAWAQRRREQQAKWQAKQTRPKYSVSRKTEYLVIDHVKRWLTEIFARRIHDGQSLIRDPDGRYRPGMRAPRIQTMDGELKRFTPDTRRELEQADHDRGRIHLAQLEFQRATSTLDFSSAEARAQLVAFLLRRLFTLTPKGPLSERQIKAEFKHLVHIADTPGVKQAIVQLAVDYLLTHKD